MAELSTSAIEHDIDAFLAQLRVERAFSPNTVLAYGRDLLKFSAFCERQGLRDVRQVEADVLRTYLSSISSDLAARSLARALSSLRSFFRFLVDEGRLQDDPTVHLVRPKIGRKLPKTASEDDLLRLLDQPDLSTLRGLRDRAMLSLTYAAGLRASEVLDLEVGDVDFDRGTISALGKGNKRRLLPIGHLTLQHVRAYLDAREQAQPSFTSTLLIVGPSGRRLTRQGFWKLVRSYALGAGLRSGFSPHSLRHSCASHLLSGGADLRTVQAFLGHASLATTEIYTHVTSDHVRMAHARSHPRG